MKKLILSLALLLAGGFGVETFAQMQLGPEWGEDPKDRQLMARAYNFMNDNIKSKNYGRAAYYLQQLMEKAPRAHVNIYILGSQMYRTRANAAEDKTEKKVYVDSLMIMYDRGVEYFGDQDPVRKRQFIESKAIDYMNLNPLDRKGIAEHYRTTIEELGNEVSPTVILTYYNELTVDFKNDDVSMEDYLMEFDRLYPLVSSLGTEEQVKQLETMLAGSGAANCENLEKIYGEQVDAKPDDIKLLETVVALLNRAGCTGTDFYLKVAEHYYKVQPSATTAIIIGSYYLEKGDTATAARYFNDALNSETNPVEKAKLSVSLAAQQLNDGNNREAYNYAQQALRNDSQNPNGYYLMAMALANGARSVQDDFGRQTVYWLVVDNLQQARQIAVANPASGMSIGQLGNLIAQFQASFPTVEEIFMRTLDEGASFTVSQGWITGKTTVRKRP